MQTGRLTQIPVRGWLRWLLRLPLWIYRARLDWLLGERFLMVTHTGRKSGLRRYTVIEVVRADRVAGQYVVASGWGEHADWLQNVQKTPQVIIATAGRRYLARAARLAPAEAEQELAGYARRHPVAFRALSRLILGRPLGNAPAELRRMGEVVPLICFAVNRHR